MAGPGSARRGRRSLNVLGIETSCDETAAAIVTGDGAVLSSVVASQAELHARFGGVVPEVASRRHLELVSPVVRAALEDAGVGLDDVDRVGVTQRPGLVGALLVGHTILVLPYSVRVVSASLSAFDFSAEEAAISLGSPPLRTFFTIVLPNIRSGVMAAFILAFITSLNDVSISVFLTGPGLSTLPIQILTYVEQFFDPTVASVSVLLMFLTVGVMAIVERTLGLTHFAK